jgi:hypothetical protein
VLSEVTQPVGAAEGRRRGRDQHLSSVPAGCDSRGPVDVRADIPLMGQKRCTGVDAHADPDRPARKFLHALARGLERSPCRGEGHEERVILGVDFCAAVPLERQAEHSAVLCERLCVVVLAEVVQQFG